MAKLIGTLLPRHEPAAVATNKGEPPYPVGIGWGVSAEAQAEIKAIEENIRIASHAARFIRVD